MYQRLSSRFSGDESENNSSFIEKHFTLTRDTKGPDSAFSLEPVEFKAMVDAVRVAEKALGKVNYGVSAKEARSRAFRRLLP